MSILAKQTIIVAGTTGIGGTAARLFGQADARIMVAGRPLSIAQTLPSHSRHKRLERLSTAATLPVMAPPRQSSRSAWKDRIDTRFHATGIRGRKMGDSPLHARTNESSDAVLRTNLHAMFQLDHACIRQGAEVVPECDKLSAPPGIAP